MSLYRKRGRRRRYGSVEHLLNEDLLRLGYARTTSFAHTYSRRFGALEDEARDAGVGLCGACQTPAEQRGGSALETRVGCSVSSNPPGCPFCQPFLEYCAIALLYET